MIEVPPLTPELLEELGRELGGCDFTGQNQRSFLSAAISRDVQAAPGNGKTTLLVAKLALLSRSWTSRSEGVCVISHTNAAREEVEKKLYAHPTASAFLSYPHFVGTVTSFIDRFIALPSLRGLGWPIHRIDDDVFAAVALSRYRSYQALRNYGYRRDYALRNFVQNLTLAQDFDSRPGFAPQRLKVQQLDQQPGAHTATGRALEELKAEITNDGYYRFADMIALAYRAIGAYPALVNALRKRFPLVLLDEAQDTNGSQLDILDRLFANGVAYQRLGDQNQTLYEDETLTTDQYWQANEGVIALGRTRRFGPEIAAFSSRITVRAPQQIRAVMDHPSRRVLILFDDLSIHDVLRTYAAQVRAHWDDPLPSGLDVRAVASRHNPSQDTTGGWPKTLIDYCPTYRSAGGRPTRTNTLCDLLRQVSISFDAHTAPREVATLIRSAIVRFLKNIEVASPDGRPITTRSLWYALRETDPHLPLTIQRLIRDRIIVGDAAWNADAWELFRDELYAAIPGVQPLAGEPAPFLQFAPYLGHERARPNEQRSCTQFDYDGVPVRLGSIHSVKGKTVDSILCVETEVYRGRALDRRTMDLEIVLPHAFGVVDRIFTDNEAQLAAATNVFVAATRTRQLLAFAMRGNVADESLRNSAADQGWNIVDLNANEQRQ
ncbi:MAG: UvrD-helicase domain-containing protein [Rhodospirillaceae bacterium]|nr:UvrD-helicase domain-containing protein [Rhodospirillaceae bacterium]MDE0363000.1 UvrD-helicase domain-containing protein [Rhodospirillaceae bacterium]